MMREPMLLLFGARESQINTVIAVDTGAALAQLCAQDVRSDLTPATLRVFDMRQGLPELCLLPCVTVTASSEVGFIAVIIQMGITRDEIRQFRKCSQTQIQMVLCSALSHCGVTWSLRGLGDCRQRSPSPGLTGLVTR